jgi:hypothetical protein
LMRPQQPKQLEASSARGQLVGPGPFFRVACRFERIRCTLYSLLRKRNGPGSKIRGAPHIAHDRGLVLPKRVPQTTRRLLACTYRQVVSEEH